MNDKVIFLLAEQEEMILLNRLFPEANKQNSEIILTGIGALNILHSLAHIDRKAHLINIGYAGSANHPVGSWVKVTEAFLHHPNVDFKEPKLHTATDVPSVLKPAEPFVYAPCYSSVDFVLMSPYKNCVFDMELAFILGMGFENVESYKFVSDNLSFHEYRDTLRG